MRKKVISLLLAATFILGMIPLLASADTGISEKGEYTYTLSSDPDTSSVPDGFGTISNNGRIWTDKSVFVDGDHFRVDLSVLAQEYVSSYSTSVTQSIAADVVFVFDMTSSMVSNNIQKGNTSVSRIRGLVDAANEAIDIITTTNPNNRITIWGYYGGTSNAENQNYCLEILPLAHYTSEKPVTNPDNETEDKYLELIDTSSSTRKIIQASSYLMEDGGPCKGNYRMATRTGTNTQYGIAKGVQGLVDDITAEYAATGHNGDRKPYVIVLTDGSSNVASGNWNDTETDIYQPTSYRNDPNAADYPNGIKHITGFDSERLTSTQGQGRHIMSSLTILTAAFWREQLRSAYETYNNGKDFGVEWFNIGLSLDDANKVGPTGISLNPEALRDANPNNGTNSSDADKVLYYLKNPDVISVNVADVPEYREDYKYIYTQGQEGGYVTFADSYSVLMNAFTTLAEIIKLGSQEYTIPIVNHEGSGQQSSDMVFTDVIGEGMYVTDITLKPNGKPPVTGVDSDEDGVYTFTGYSTTVTVTEDPDGNQTLVWNLPASEVAMFTFKDREDVTTGEYIPADPTVLSFGVDFTNSIEMGPAYTNAFDNSDPNNKVPLTTVTYEIPGDNDYYFDVITDSDHKFVSSTIKTNLVNNIISTGKTSNPTDTAVNSSAYAYTPVNNGTEDSSANVTGHLGNNGKATFLSRKENIEITVEKRWIDKNGAVITDTSELPTVKVLLYRKADGSDVGEIAKTALLNSLNGYSLTYTVPIRDSNDKRYTYYIEEECPDGYFIADISTPLRAYDGTLAVTNREFSNGSIIVKKQWKNQVGGVITDTSSLPEINVKLKRHVSIETPVKHTVTISLTDNQGSIFDQDWIRTVQVVEGAQIQFTLRVYFMRTGSSNSNRASANANNASISLNGTTVNSTVTSVSQGPTYAEDGISPGTIQTNLGGTVYCREVDQTFTVNSDLTLDYVVNGRGVNNRNTSTQYGYFPHNYGTALKPDYIYPYMVQNWSVTPPQNIIYIHSDGVDQEYESFQLNSTNRWEKAYTDLPVSEVDENGVVYNYLYYVEEISNIPGFITTYSTENTTGIERGVLTVTNKSDSPIGPLPGTGGRGSPHIARVIGFFAIFFSAMLFVFRTFEIPRRKRRRADN